MKTNCINATNEYRAEVVLVTPGMAAEWLATSEGNPRWKNNPNRSDKTPKLADERRVKSLANDIQRGDWAPGTNGVGFNVEGHLVEGHHRLNAIVKSGVAVPLVVVYGISKEAELHIDDNKIRTEIQRTGLSCYILGAVSIHKAILEGYSSPRNVSTTTEEKLRVVDLHPNIYVADRLANAGRKGGLRCASGTHAFMCALEFGLSESKVQHFVECVNTGFIDSPQERAAIICRNYLMNKRPEPIRVSSVIQCALYDFSTGNPRTRAYKNVRGKFFDMNLARGNKLYSSLFGDN